MRQPASPAAQMLLPGAVFALALVVGEPLIGLAGLAILVSLGVLRAWPPADHPSLSLTGAHEGEDVSDARLVDAFRAGDPSALDELSRRYFDRIHACTRLSVLEDKDPERVLEDKDPERVARCVFARVAAGLDRTPPPPELSFRIWLFRIARATMADARAGSLGRAPGGPARPEPRDEDARRELVLAADHWIDATERETLRAGLAPGESDILALCYVLDLTIEELATALDRSPAAVRDLLARGISALAERAARPDCREGSSDRFSIVERARHAPVLSARRSALAGRGGCGGDPWARRPY